LALVVGAGGDPTGYLYGGLTVSLGIRAVLQYLDTDISSFRQILDLGCGTARVLRWFADCSPSTELYGTDIHSESIEWCVQNIPFARFLKTDALPPLPFPDQSFDLIFAISVFTHLNEELQLAWLDELRRIAKPGALILISVHGEDRAAGGLWAGEYLEFLNRGFFYKAARQLSTVQGLPGFYQVAFHSREYIERTWSPFLDLRAYLKHGPLYSQELMVCEKAGKAGPSRASLPIVDLPIAALDSPVTGSIQDEFHLDVSGWAFYPRRDECPRVTVWIDGKPVATCLADQPRPDVGGVFFAHENAQSPGFVQRISINHLNRGEHLLYLSLENDWFPLCAVYFVVRFNPWVRLYQRSMRLLGRMAHAVKQYLARIRVAVRIRTRLKRLLRRLLQTWASLLSQWFAT
jgi:SAM-dependent methyltransferase